MNSQKVTTIGNYVARFLLGDTVERVARIEEGVKRIDKDVDKIKSSLKDIVGRLSGHDVDIAGMKVRVYGSPGSPMQPNDQGKKLLTDSGFYQAYPLIKNDLFALMDKLETKTLYDAEKNAEKCLQQLSNQNEFRGMKDYAVNHPDESLDLIFKVASWIIRDDYASAKGINVS